VIHLLVVSVSRRRRETGLLKAPGFVRAQVASAVAWQATTLALVGVGVGVGLRIVVGGSIWKVFATDLGVIPVTVVPGWTIAALAGGVVAGANLLAVTPALAAARTNPAQLLRVP
jgi:putative ABC transport system permease protein